jgi:archaellum component FlaC
MSENSNFDSERANFLGQIEAYKKQIADMSEELHSVKAELKELESFKHSYEEKQRKDLEEQVHAILPEFNCSGKDNQILEATVHGYLEAAKLIETGRKKGTPDAEEIPAEEETKHSTPKKKGFNETLFGGSK